MTDPSLPDPAQPFTPERARAFMEGCLDPAADPDAVGRALLALQERTPEASELAAFAEVLLEKCRPCALSPEGEGGSFLDTCGTGGDARGGVHTANLSTLAALALAHLGVPLVKHGNRAASSRCGSADLLEALGLDLDSEPVPGAPFTFLYAPRHHPVLARVAPVRRALGVPTVFNLLGPLLNPARPPLQLLGVARMAWMAPMAGALAVLGVDRALVVHGRTQDGRGLDEASMDGPTFCLPVERGRVRKGFTLLPGDAGLREGLAPVEPGTRSECVDLARGLAGGRRHKDYRSRLAEEVALQAGLGLLLARDLDQGSLGRAVREAREALEEGMDLEALLFPPLPEAV